MAAHDQNSGVISAVRRQGLLVLLLLLSLPLNAAADVVRLKSGRTLEGRVEEMNESLVRIRLYSSLLVVNRSLIVDVTEENDAADAWRLYQSAAAANRNEEAERFLEEAVALAPENTTYGDALAGIQSAHRKASVDQSLERARKMASMRDFRLAIALCEDLIKANAGNDLEPYLKRETASIMADYAYDLYNHFAESQALQMLARARDLDSPNNPSIHLALARIAVFEKNFDAALDEYEAVKATAPREAPQYQEAEKRLATLPDSRVEPPPSIPVKPSGDIDTLVLDSASRHGFKPDFIHRIIMLESSRRPNARSEDDARGLMQIRRGAWEDMAKLHNLAWKFDESAYEPSCNIEIGCAYLAWMRDDFFPRYRDEIGEIDQEELLLQGYHAGPNRTVYYRGRVPGKRTRQYVARYTQLKLAAATP